MVKTLFMNIWVLEFTSLLKMTEDFDKICRTCLEEITDFKYLFNMQYINEENLRLSEILTACTSIEVLENDNLPKQVCIKCEKNILNAFSFQQLCHQSDSVLKAILSQSVQSELIELKPLVNVEEANNIFNYNVSKQEQVNNLVNNVENSTCYLNKSIKDELTSDKILNEDSDCLLNAGRSLASEQENNSYSFNEKPQENDLLPSYKAEEKETTHKDLHTYMEVEHPLSSLKNENNLLSSCHTEPEDSQHVEPKLNIISSKDTTFKQYQVNNLDEAVNVQLTSVKILKEDHDDDAERNFRDQGHIESISNSSNKNHENGVLPNYYGGVQHIERNDIPEDVEGETLQPLLHCEAKECVPSYTALEDLKEHSNKHLPTLSQHMNSKLEPNKKTHICNDCGKGFESSYSLKRHIQIHPEGPFSCETCGEIFAQSSRLLEHMKSHPNVKHFFCKLCVRTFSGYAYLLAHNKVHNRVESHKCPKCDKRLSSQRCLARHMQIHTGQKKFVCKFCKKCFSGACYLTIHERVHTGERPYSCNICGKSFVDSPTLTVHRRIHSGEKPFVCTYCGRGCVSSSQLKKHTRTHTGEKPYQCNLCTKSFFNSADLKRHTIEVHTDERNHVCDICGKRYSTKSRLKEHMRTHTGERNHICEICHKGFVRKSALNTHMTIHTGARTHICHICNKGFNQKGTLKTHMTLHTGARNHICHICNKGFNQKGTLKTHMTLHTGETPFRCNVCNKAFPHKANYWAHMKSHKRKEELEADEEVTLL